jgi:hypothetical protein
LSAKSFILLLRCVDQTHAIHSNATTALRSLLRSGDRVCVTPQNIIEFWSVCTRPVDRNGLALSPGEADREASRLEGLLSPLPCKELAEEEASGTEQIADLRLQISEV